MGNIHMEKTVYTVKATVKHPMPPLIGTGALCEAGALELRVLYALCELENATVERIAQLLGAEEGDVAAAIGYWRGAGAATVADAAVSVSEEPPKPEAVEQRTELSAEEMASYIRDGGLAELIDHAEAQCGRTFNRPDLAALIRLVEDFGLDGAYILTLLAYCDNMSGEHKSVRYAERVATTLINKGITTCTALEEYIQNHDALRSVEGRLRSMFGIGARKLTSREEECFLRWTKTFGYGEDMIGAAYDVTVGATGKASISYANKVLTAWYEAGLHTPAEAEAHMQKERAARSTPQRKPKKAAPPADGVHASFDVGDFFRRAVDRSYSTDSKKSDTSDT